MTFGSPSLASRKCAKLAGDDTTYLSRLERRPALQTRRRPYFLHVVIHFEDRYVLRQDYPGELRAREDVRVGRDRLIQRRGTHEQQYLPPAIIAPQRRLALRATVNVVRIAGVRLHGDRDGLALHELHM